MSGYAESEVEEVALAWFERLGYEVAFGPDLGPGGSLPERQSWSEVVLVGRFRRALARLNPGLQAEALDEALRRLLRRASPSFVLDNQRFHSLLVEGMPVETRRPDGSLSHVVVKFVDFEHVNANEFFAVNQYTVVDGQSNRRPDIVVFVNGLPLAVLELKNPADENATVWSAFKQLQTYKAEIPSLFVFNELLVASDGLEARLGSLTADRERFVAWKTIEGRELAPTNVPQLEVLLRGAFEPARFLRLVRHFIVFEATGGEPLKKLAAYHQFHAVESAVAQTLRASGPNGDRRVGVVWHTQGSGKSLTMVFYAGRIVVEPAMDNPTLVVLTDRNDLDGQLFGVFSNCTDLLRQTPDQAESRDDLQGLLRSRASGGVIFTTIQKFAPDESATYPVLSERRNIIVIADEAHRSQYSFDPKFEQKTGEVSYGFAKHLRDGMPNASFIGFTGTPIDLTDRSTRAVFGDYIDVYDIEQAVKDGSTVPIYWESRLARLELDEDEKPHIDEELEEVTEGEDEQVKQKLKTKWAALEAVVGSQKRLELVAKDLVEHWERRLAAMDGKGLIVCMSRRICVALFDELVRLRPEWDDRDEAKGAIKVVMTGSAADGPTWQRHIRSKDGRDYIAKRFKDADDPLKLVIVRDMWLTGFDAPPLHTLYADKPMRGHGLMQAIARVNRVFRDKPGGLIVDYLGLAEELKLALATYTSSGGRGTAAEDIEAEATAVMLEKYEIVATMYHGFDWGTFFTGSAMQRLQLVADALDHLLGLEDGRARYLREVTALSRAYALVSTTDEAAKIRDDVAFFQAVRAALAKQTTSSGKTPEELDQAVRQIVSRALVTDEVVDIFAVAGLDKPDISILSEQFLEEVRLMPRRNLAVEVLDRLLKDQVRAALRRNITAGRSFSEMLERTLTKYHNRSIETAQVIEELIELAKSMKAEQDRGQKLHLSDAEVAFYDALSTNRSAVDVLGDAALTAIARELVKMLRANVTIDWTIKDAVRANLRRLVRRILNRYGYPPDLQEEATLTVLRQAEVLAEELAA